MLSSLTASFCLLVYLTGNVVLGGQPPSVRLPQHLDEIQRPYHKFQKRIPSLSSARQGDEFRLSGDLEPVSYNIRLLPFIEEGNFTTDGYIEIVFNCIAATDNLTLNSAEIMFMDSLVKVDDLITQSQYQVIAFIDEQETREMVTFRIGDSFQPGHQYKIAFTFTSSLLNEEFRGFYRSSYVENGETKYLAVSQFEASDARRAFPCFDEPNMKATFKITLGRKTSMISASNTPLYTSISIDGVPGYVWDMFEPSPIMSSYLVALLVAEYDVYDSEQSLSNVKFRILSRPDIIDKMEYSSNIGPRVLEFYENFFGVDYPIAKEDMAAVPDFWPGAMENWGLVTYQEYLLTHEDTDSASQKESVVSVIAHELAHQWFGDLVTADWWGLIWLNEGFASYQQRFAIDAVEPSFQSRDRFSVEVLHNVMMTDAQESSHPMSYDVQQSPELNSVFDAIAYDKGASVIRMAADIVGLETFQRAMTRYLTRESYENAVEDDLWQALEEQAEIDGVVLPYTVQEIMHSWTRKKNYPLVTITREYGDSEVAVATQERFLLKERQDYEDPTVYLWYVPLTHISSSSDGIATAWMTDKQINKSFITLGAANDEWVIFNVNQQGYYRVAYDAINYGLIADQLITDHLNIPVQNRAQLLDDSFVLALANKISYAHALDLSLYLKYEAEYVPWHSVLSEFDYIDSMLFDQPEHSNWKDHLTELVEPYYKMIGFEESDSDSLITIYARNDAIAWGCRLKIGDCVNNVKAAYGDLMAAPNMMLSPNQRSLILNLGVENGGKAEYDFAFDQYKASGDGSFLTAMCYTRVSSNIYGLLEMIVEPNSDIKDLNTVFYYLAGNPLGNTIAFDFLINRWDDVQAAAGVEYMPFFYNYLARRLNTQEDLDKYIMLRDSHLDVLGNSSYVQSGIDQVKSNVNWMETNQYEIRVWLDPSSSTTEATTLPTTETSTETVPTSTDSITTTDSSTSPTETVSASTISVTTPGSTSSSDSTSSSSSTTSTTTTTTQATPPTDSAIRIEIPQFLLALMIIFSSLFANRRN